MSHWSEQAKNVSFPAKPGWFPHERCSESGGCVEVLSSTGSRGGLQKTMVLP